MIVVMVMGGRQALMDMAGHREFINRQQRIMEEGEFVPPHPAGS